MPDSETDVVQYEVEEMKETGADGESKRKMTASLYLEGAALFDVMKQGAGCRTMAGTAEPSGPHRV